MKLTFDLSMLWGNVHEMNAEESDFLVKSKGDGLQIDWDVELDGGVEVELENVQAVGGVLSVQGHQVLLYIPDHSGKIEQTLMDGSKGNKFHVADCSTLQKMRDSNRFERYTATNDVSGEFSVFGSSGYSFATEKKGKAKLVVCKNCLKHLNYKGYRNSRSQSDIFKNFLLTEFFARHSTLFKNIPNLLVPKDTGYSSHWKQISRSYRDGVNYVCEQCRVNLLDHKRLLHCHHINGLKSDNSKENLLALCFDCHRKQPQHDHMHLPSADMILINQLRRAQGFFDESSWDEVLELVDSSFHGVLTTFQRRGFSIPQVGFELQDEYGEIVASVEVAWPRERKALVLNEDEKRILESLGWKAKTLSAALGDTVIGI